VSLSNSLGAIELAIEEFLEGVHDTQGHTHGQGYTQVRGEPRGEGRRAAGGYSAAEGGGWGGGRRRRRRRWGERRGERGGGGW